MYSERFDEALAFAAAIHREQVRKLSDEDIEAGKQAIPYIGHLLAVAALVIEHGGNEDQAIAGLLHDAIEDAGETAESIEARFGPAVARIVEDCTDAWERPKPAWATRKRAYIERLHKKAPDSLLVSLADKVHNSRAILQDYRAEGSRVWKRFNPSPEHVLWYYDELSKVFTARLAEVPAARLAQQLRETVDLLVRETGLPPTAPAGE